MNCINSGLCIFDKRPIQTDIEDTKFQKYYPTHTIEQGGPIEFLIDGQSESYIDLQDIFLNLQYRIKKADGSNIRKADDKVAPINLPIASLFRDVSVIVGEKQIEGGNSLYPYTSYLKSLLQFQSQAKKTHLEVMGWYKDEAGDMESDTNDGHGKRKATIKDTKPTELFGPLFRDIFQQEKLLINNTSMRIKLLPSKPEFALMAFGATSDFKIVVKSAILYVRRRVIAPGVINGHAKGMQTQNAHYPVNHTDIISFTIPANTRTHIKEQLFPGQQPKFLILGMVENDAFNGNIKKNPFNFQHFKMNKLGIYKDGSSVGMDVLSRTLIMIFSLHHMPIPCCRWLCSILMIRMV